MRSPLTVLFTASLFGIIFLPATGVWANSKSAIAPDVLEPTPLATPPIEPSTASTVTLEAPTSAPTPPPASPVVPQVVVDIPEPLPPRTGVKADSAVPEIILESRSSGCHARSSELGQRRADLCGGDFPPNHNRDEQTPVRVRTLNPREIRQLSVPSQSDRQMVFPLNIPAIISSPFGDRWHPIHGGIRFHQGTDLAAPAGTPVVAAFSGRVEIAAWVGGYGLMVVINHDNRYETRYAHLAELFVQEGQEITQGTVIGLVGSTGNSTGPHLHFELWEQIKGEWYVLDPTPHLLVAMERLEQYLAQLTQPTRSEIKPSV